MDLFEEIWCAVGGDAVVAQSLDITGRQDLLPSAYRVTELAAAAVGAAALAVAELGAARTGADMPAVRVERAHAARAFGSEARQRPIRWELPATWDPLAGDYLAADGWVRLHTNYAHHRRAALTAIGVPEDREALAAAVAALPAMEVESAVVSAGGCAAAMASTGGWSRSRAGRAVAAEPLVAWSSTAGAAGLDPSSRPLEGIRVLDLTRVLAGPVATRFLAAFGADVLRVDPPGFEEVAAILPETTVGKRCARVDLRDRARLAALVRAADVVVLGLRPSASVTVETAWLREQNPSVVVSRHVAYGWSGPWASRRGFDSLVQMSCGIAARQMELRGADRPSPLPVQALDHATGYLVAAAICRALTDRVRLGVASEVRTSLARTALLLLEAGEVDHLDGPALVDDPRHMERADTWWGPIERVSVPATIDGHVPSFAFEAGPLGRTAAGFAPRISPAAR